MQKDKSSTLILICSPTQKEVAFMKKEMTVALKVSYECENCRNKSSYPIELTGYLNLRNHQESYLSTDNNFGVRECPSCGYTQSWMIKSSKSRGLFITVAISTVVLVVVAGLVANGLDSACSVFPAVLFISFIIGIVASSIYNPNKKFAPIQRINKPTVRTIRVIGNEDPVALEPGHTCDVCGRTISEKDGALYATAEFGKIIDNGFLPDESKISTLRMISRVTGGDSDNPIKMSAPLSISPLKIAKQRNGTLQVNITDWLLCPECSTRANQYINDEANFFDSNKTPKEQQVERTTHSKTTGYRAGNNNEMVTHDMDHGKSTLRTDLLVVCPKCKTRVLPKTDGTCPSCQAKISKR